jgi:hypothetical protein
MYSFSRTSGPCAARHGRNAQRKARAVTAKLGSMSARVRSLLAAIAVAAVLSHGLSGHGPSPMSDSDGVAGVAAGLCVLLATGLGLIAIARPASHHTPAVREAAVVTVALPMSPPVDGGARASPTALMRLRN